MTTSNGLSLKKGKKGFTLTELAIVIAVIAILIAVLVPTFSSVISKAKASNESVACANEWQNFYIDADIAANGTKDDYLVVYTDNEYEDDNNNTYYHGYLATAGVYDSEKQLNVTIDTDSGIATCNGESYKPIGTYEYMAEGKIIIYTNSKTSTTATTATSYQGNNPYKDSTSAPYTIDNRGITISGYNDTYYVTGTLNANTNAAQNLWDTTSEGGYPTSIFYIRIYYPLSCGDIAVVTKVDYSGDTAKTYKCWNRETSSETNVNSWSDEDISEYDIVNSDKEDIFDNTYKTNDTYAYTEFTLNGEMTKFVIKYYTSTEKSSLAGTITIYNNASQPA